MILVLNLKMNLSKDRLLEYENNLKDKNVIVLPQFPYLAYFNPDIYSLGAQDVSEHIKGSYTGEVCAKCLSELGCKYGLVCHYERELYFNENKETSKLKIENLLKYDIIPIYCINDMDNSDILDKLSILDKSIKNIIIAYEAGWLIGKELNEKDLNKIKERIKLIKSELIKRNINYKIIYGGGINSKNIDYIIKKEIVDGFILSSNILDINSFNEIYNKINK